MRIIFCSDPLDTRQVDEAYSQELDAAVASGFEYSLINFEVLVDEHAPAQAVRRVKGATSIELGVYRGWMLKPDAYALLYQALLERGISLINDPASYQHCHYLPESYPDIQTHTSRTVWLELNSELDMSRVMQLLVTFGDKPIVVKDFVKSQKHYWSEAFYIPSASDAASVEKIVRRFIELQGTDLNKGLVFREFAELETLAANSSMKMPIAQEYRLFFLDGELLVQSEYWDDATYSNSEFSTEPFQTIAKKIPSRFFTMDIAKRRNVDWMIVELGDAQVAGLPAKIDIQEFYSALAEKLTRPQ